MRYIDLNVTTLIFPLLTKHTNTNLNSSLSDNLFQVMSDYTFQKTYFIITPLFLSVCL